jgi:hypothetical protein
MSKQNFMFNIFTQIRAVDNVEKYGRVTHAVGETYFGAEKLRFS